MTFIRKKFTVALVLALILIPLPSPAVGPAVNVLEGAVARAIFTLRRPGMRDADAVMTLFRRVTAQEAADLSRLYPSFVGRINSWEKFAADTWSTNTSLAMEVRTGLAAIERDINLWRAARRLELEAKKQAKAKPPATPKDDAAPPPADGAPSPDVPPGPADDPWGSGADDVIDDLTAANPITYSSDDLGKMGFENIKDAADVTLHDVTKLKNLDDVDLHSIFTKTEIKFLTGTMSDREIQKVRKLIQKYNPEIRYVVSVDTRLGSKAIRGKLDEIEQGARIDLQVAYDPYATGTVAARRADEAFVRGGRERYASPLQLDDPLLTKAPWYRKIFGPYSFLATHWKIHAAGFRFFRQWVLPWEPVLEDLGRLRMLESFVGIQNSVAVHQMRAQVYAQAVHEHVEMYRLLNTETQNALRQFKNGKTGAAQLHATRKSTAGNKGLPEVIANTERDILERVERGKDLAGIPGQVKGEIQIARENILLAQARIKGELNAEAQAIAGKAEAEIAGLEREIEKLRLRITSNGTSPELADDLNQIIRAHRVKIGEQRDLLLKIWNNPKNFAVQLKDDVQAQVTRHEGDIDLWSRETQELTQELRALPAAATQEERLRLLGEINTRANRIQTAEIEILSLRSNPENIANGVLGTTHQMQATSERISDLWLVLNGADEMRDAKKAVQAWREAYQRVLGHEPTHVPAWNPANARTGASHWWRGSGESEFYANLRNEIRQGKYLPAEQRSTFATEYDRRKREFEALRMSQEDAVRQIQSEKEKLAALQLEFVQIADELRPYLMLREGKIITTREIRVMPVDLPDVYVIPHEFFNGSGGFQRLYQECLMDSLKKLMRQETWFSLKSLFLHTSDEIKKLRAEYASVFTGLNKKNKEIFAPVLGGKKLEETTLGQKIKEFQAARLKQLIAKLTVYGVPSVVTAAMTPAGEVAWDWTRAFFGDADPDKLKDLEKNIPKEDKRDDNAPTPDDPFGGNPWDTGGDDPWSTPGGGDDPWGTGGNDPWSTPDPGSNDPVFDPWAEEPGSNTIIPTPIPGGGR